MHAALRRRLFRALAVLLGLGLGCLAGELWARATRDAPLAERLPLLRVQAHDGRGWEMVPGEDHYTYRERVTVNALGLRGAEIESKVPGELRVLALGDSLVYGQGVGDDETLPLHLERVLGERVERPVTVVNGGLRAYATHQELGLLRHLGAAVEPDVVLLFWYWNDVDERDLAATAERLRESGPIAFDLGAAPEGLPLWKWRAKQLLRRSAFAMVLNDQLRDAGDGHPWQRSALDDVEKLREYLPAFQTECDALGAQFCMLAIPPSAAVGRPHPADAVTARAEAIAAELGVSFTRLGTDLAAHVAAGGELPIVPYDGHYDDEGNRLLALEAARFLATREWFAATD